MATIFDILLNQHLNNNFQCNKLSSSSSQEHQNEKQVRIDFIPELDVIETKESFIIETELPGVNKEDIQVEIKDSKLYIQGEKKRSSYINNNSLKSNEKSNNEQPSIEEFEDDIKSTTTAASAEVKSTTSTSTNDKKESNVNKDKQVVNTSSPSTTVAATTSPKDQIKNYISERSYGNFKRYLDLTRILYTLDLSTIKSQFNNGLLTIVINKKQHYSNTIKINL